MGFAKGTTFKTKEDIYKEITDFDILSYYLDIEEIPCVIHSPIREDKRPSFGLYSSNATTISYKDFSSGDRGGTLDLFMQIWNLSYSETLDKIYKDVPNILKKEDKKHLSISNIKEPHKLSIKIEVKIREWKPWDEKYWFDQYNINREWLKFGRVYPISHIFITKSKVTYTLKADKYAYAYFEYKEGNTSIKVYQPYSEFFKWRNNHDASTWDLWEQLPEKGEVLIITSSRKDALCIWANTGIPTCSLQAESCLPKIHVVQQLKNRFKKIFVLYDNDYTKKQNWGKLFGKRMAQEFDLIQIELPLKYKSKDSSDLCKLHGSKTLKKVILDLIK